MYSGKNMKRFRLVLIAWLILTTSTGCAALDVFRFVANHSGFGGGLGDDFYADLVRPGGPLFPGVIGGGVTWSDPPFYVP